MSDLTILGCIGLSTIIAFVAGLAVGEGIERQRRHDRDMRSLDFNAAPAASDRE